MYKHGFLQVLQAYSSLNVFRVCRLCRFYIWTGFTEEMFDEVTVCEVADRGETGLVILSLCRTMKGFLLDGSGL